MRAQWDRSIARFFAQVQNAKNRLASRKKSAKIWQKATRQRSAQRSADSARIVDSPDKVSHESQRDFRNVLSTGRPLFVRSDKGLEGGSDKLRHVRRLAARAKATSLSQGSRGAGPVSSSADAKATQGGDVEVDAKAIAAAQAEVKNDIAEAVAGAISIVKRGGSASSQASTTAEAVGVATARAAVVSKGGDNFQKVDATGSAIGSGAAEASAKSVPTVVASAIANAFSSAKGGSSEATSAVKSSVSSSGIATAAARARVVAESKGGSIEVVQVVRNSDLTEGKIKNRGIPTVSREFSETSEDQK
ncbi:hypothetical protein BSKO_14143 [Bryopsis sp. KO-2023]|nr:hypothetical protein BSKO_14143 [Bryopsis sp. KO-2023]